jgi:hypothetical protein
MHGSTKNKWWEGFFSLNMDIYQAAKVLNVHPRTIIRRWHRGELKGAKKGRSHALDIQIEIDTFLTVAELAKKMHCSPRWVQKLIDKKAIICRRQGKGFIVHYLEANEIANHRNL